MTFKPGDRAYRMHPGDGKIHSIVVSAVGENPPHLFSRSGRRQVYKGWASDWCESPELAWEIYLTRLYSGVLKVERKLDRVKKVYQDAKDAGLPLVLEE